MHVYWLVLSFSFFFFFFAMFCVVLNIYNNKYSFYFIVAMDLTKVARSLRFLFWFTLSMIFFIYFLSWILNLYFCDLHVLLCGNKYILCCCFYLLMIIYVYYHYYAIFSLAFAQCLIRKITDTILAKMFAFCVCCVCITRVILFEIWWLKLFLFVSILSIIIWWMWYMWYNNEDISVWSLLVLFVFCFLVSNLLPCINEANWR